MDSNRIRTNVYEIIASLPEHVQLVAAAKTRTAEEVNAAIEGGVTVVGYNYVQEAAQIKPHIERPVEWHMIGHLQKNKVKKAVELFDMIETIDSMELAEAVNRHCENAGKVMPVLIEVNSAREQSKSGVIPDDIESLVDRIAQLPHIRIQGLMTMGAYATAPNEIRGYFQDTRQAFDKLNTAAIENVKMRYLSMGMSDSYRIAIEEGANMVRIGTALFGSREQ